MPKRPAGALLLGFNIDRKSSRPIYRQLDDELRRLILQGLLAPAQKLPSTRELASDLDVSRTTIKSVYEQLVAEGFAEARTGAGTFVAHGLEPDRPPQIERQCCQPASPQIEVSKHLKFIRSSRASIRHGQTNGFRPGVPALDQFPVKAWSKYLSEELNLRQHDNFSYGQLTGCAALRLAISRHLADARGLQADPAQIIVTSGAQQAFVMIAFALINRGETVWYEDPGHIAGRDVFKAMGANVASVPIDAEGLDLDYAISKHRTPAVIFTTPSHQQPLGTTMSLVRRLAILNYAQSNDAWIIEDDYDSEFRYRGRPLPALSALDSARRVFYVGTFSKSMFAAIRLGYIVVPPPLVDTFAKARNLLGHGASAIVESAMARFMGEGRFVEHIRKMRRVYRARRDVLHECLLRDCTTYLEPQQTDAGMHMLAWLKRGIDDQTAHTALLEAGIESLPLSVYATESSERQALVLGFTGVEEVQIAPLVRRMASVLKTLSK